MSSKKESMRPWYMDLLDLRSSGPLVLAWHVNSCGGFGPVWFELHNTGSGP